MSVQKIARPVCTVNSYCHDCKGIDSLPGKYSNSKLNLKGYTIYNEDSTESTHSSATIISQTYVHVCNYVLLVHTWEARAQLCL